MELRVGAAGWWHVIFFGLVLPYAAIRSKRRMVSAPLPGRRRFYVSAVVQQVCLAVLSVLVARLEWIPLLPARVPPWWALPLAAGVTVSLVAGMRPLWRAAVSRGERRAYLLMPADVRERMLWAAVSLTAGIGEEITYRGVLFAILWRASGSVPAAALGSAAIFAISHWVQGARSIVIIFGFSLLFQGIAWVTGSLVTGMLVHFAYDLCAGLTYAHLGRLLGYTPRAGSPSHSPTPTVP